MAAAQGKVGSWENMQKPVTLEARKSPWWSRLRPTSCPKVCLQGSLSTGSLSPQAHWPVQCSAFPGEGCLLPSPPLPAPFQGVSSHLPPLLQTAVIQRESHCQGNQKKKKKEFQAWGKFQPQSKWFQRSIDSTQDAAWGSRLCQHCSPSTGHTHRGVGRERNVSPKWKLKLLITFCCHHFLATGSLQLQELKKS